ncbi:relaxase/mobilization nuclease domain-containing protein [Bradyrhizobium acaciae]|uniref:relaxase/mobilization nuclease domain-containing protein n=1 Tax=Bradyrhizobium acaciae TaxID=2683706 RepID=UPI001E531C11|nr:relaxase/mobilization nuclease domain-containing protein [Bradyrhizobium acaciae]MCC8978883.1 relaxase/mobilization nuclease domain-containing protein [Bradyrhizobium acaciae]
MIVKIQKAGSSFKGLTNYLINHEDRVAWTHSLNCANDDVKSVVNELYITASQAEYLKEQAGVHAGGTVVDKPVKHISLNWHPSEQPTREDMIEAAEQFLKRMGWDEHQALLVAHQDKAHRHVHIELNRIHPETGRALNDNFERNRASDWANEYERDRGKIYCEDRERDPSERTPAPSRETWRQLREAESKYVEDEKASLERLEENYFKRGDREHMLDSREWHILKDDQRKEREAFFAESKAAYKELRTEVYREVREKFREDWGNYYAAVRAGIDGETLVNWKTTLVDLQKETLEKTTTEAFGMLREIRKEEYQQLLAEHRSDRQELARAQSDGRRSYDLLQRVGANSAEQQPPEETTPANQNEATIDEAKPAAEEVSRQKLHLSYGTVMLANSIGEIGATFIVGVAELGERLFDGFFGGKPVQREKPRSEPDHDGGRQREAGRLQRVEEAIETARLEREQRDQEFWQDRERRRG